MNRRYRLHLSAQVSTVAWLASGRPYLSEETLVQALGQATVRQLIMTNPQQPEMDIELAADSHEQAVWTVLAALNSIGFDVSRIVIVDLVKAAMQRAIFGAGGFGALGLPTKNPWAVLALAGLGAIIGVMADVAVNEAWATIMAERIEYTSQWRFAEIPAPMWSPREA